LFGKRTLPFLFFSYFFAVWILLYLFLFLDFLFVIYGKLVLELANLLEEKLHYLILLGFLVCALFLATLSSVFLDLFFFIMERGKNKTELCL